MLRLCQYFGAQGGVRLLRHQPQLAPAQEGGPAVHRREAGRRRARGARDHRPLRHGEDVEGVHAHRRLGDEHGRRARRGRLLRPLRAGDRGALPRPLDRQGRRAGAAAARTCSATRTTGSRSTTRTTRCGTSGCSRSSRPARSATSAARNGTAGSSTRPRCSAPRYVIPNFVAGVEMAKPFGFETVDEAIASTTEGLDYFMSRGITPRFTTWCPEPTTPLGRDNPNGAPLEYHIRLLEAYRATLEKHGLKPPPGYGVAGAGQRGVLGQLVHGHARPGRGHGRGGRARRDRAHHRSTRRATLWHEASDEELKALAREARDRWHEPNRATYMVMRIINYTNVCVAQCDYCAFYVLPNQDGGYVLSREEVFAKIDELLEVGGDLVAFNGGFNPKLPLDFYCDLFAAVRAALRRPRRVLRADDRGVRLPRRPRGALVRRRRRAAARRGRALDHRRRQRDPHRGLPQAARQVQVHGARVLRGAARDRRERA